MLEPRVASFEIKDTRELPYGKFGTSDYGSGFSVLGSGFWILRSGFRIQGSGFEAQNLGISTSGTKASEARRDRFSAISSGLLFSGDFSFRTIQDKRKGLVWRFQPPRVSRFQTFMCFSKPELLCRELRKTKGVGNLKDLGVRNGAWGDAETPLIVIRGNELERQM